LGTVDAAWVERAAEVKAHTGPAIASLVREFANRHPHPLLKVGDVNDEGPYLNISQVDLDGDGCPETLLFIGGQDSADTLFYVLKKHGSEWWVLHREHVWMHNEEPDFGVLEGSTKAKCVRLTHLYERGSGIWLFSHRIYRMNKGRFRLVLEIVKDSNFALGTEPINGTIRPSDLVAEGDHLSIAYTYQFSPSFSVLRDLGLMEQSEEGSILIQGKASIRFTWDPAHGRYRAEDPCLDDRRMKCFFKPWDRTLFRRAFRPELIGVAAHGTPAQQEMARYFLSEK
jgi:hypothetical protein